MEKEINIADILQDKPKGTKLYSPAFGDVRLDTILGDKTYCIQIKDADNNYYKLTEYGKLSPNGECMLFPSNKMYDWKKFQWKKGDVLTDGDKHVIFKDWNNDYTQFQASFGYISYNLCRENLILRTDVFVKCSNNVAQTIIGKIKEHYGDRLNLQTFKIEKPQFKPFDKVLVRADHRSHWILSLYSHKTEYCHVCINGSTYLCCAPYNDQTAHLLGTTDDWKGGNND